MYICVVDIFECQSNSCILLRSAHFDKRVVAKECLRV